MELIWARGQEYPDYFHSPNSGVEVNTTSDPMFYRKDELKYHGHANHRGSDTINFYGKSLNLKQLGYFLQFVILSSNVFLCNCVIIFCKTVWMQCIFSQHSSLWVLVIRCFSIRASVCHLCISRCLRVNPLCADIFKKRWQVISSHTL